MPKVLVLLIVGAFAGTTACSGSDDGDADAGVVCGNGVLELGETCDGSALGGVTCIDLGWTMGALGCKADCSLDVLACVGGGPQCGNWTVEWGEACDTSDLAGASRGSIGYGAGELGCREDCTFDPTDCGPPTSCGNHVLEDPEECDGPDLDDRTCESLGHLGGDLGCGSNCVIDETRCTDAECGDGVQEGQEECDGTDLNDRDCVMLGYTSGVLDCSEYCLFDDSGCS